MERLARSIGQTKPTTTTDMLNPAIFNQIDIPRVKSAEDLLKEQLGIAQINETMQTMKDSRAERNALRQLLGSGQTGETLETSLMRAGLLKPAQEARKSRLDAEHTTAKTANETQDTRLKKAQETKYGADTRAKELEAAQKRLEFVSNVIGSAKDQPSYTQARAALAQNGMDVASIPELFDPAQVAAAGQQTITALQRIQEERAKVMADETVRSNKARETETAANNLRLDDRTRSEGAANRSVTMRGQNMTDARSRDAEKAPVPITIVDPKNPSQMITVNGRTYNQNTGEGVIGVSGKEPSAAKKNEQAQTGKDQLSNLLTNLRDSYSQLEKGGGIQNSENGMLSNVASRIQSTGVGQTLGQFTGTKNQKLRDSIEQTRPLLLQAIKQATGMSAKQMDSNAEMRLFLAAATDPTKDIQANLEALDNLERMFVGQGARPTQTQASTAKQPTSTLPKGWKVEPD